MSDTISVDLIRKYLANQCSPQEIAEVHQWFNSYQHSPDSVAELSPEEKQLLGQRLFDRITKDIQMSSAGSDFIIPEPEDKIDKVEKTAAIFILKRLTIAAVAIICIGLAFYILPYKTVVDKKMIVKAAKPKDLPPGGNRALLTLGNGTTIILDSAQNGTLATQGNIKINKTRNGQLIYTINNNGQNTDQIAKINTISTPLGGQYQVILPDGSKVWLNSKSTLRFPDFFQGTERRVEITGEVYFEVAKNPRMPFRVKSKNAEIEVLGTHFDIMAYDDEGPQKTTLLEGSVKISTDKGLNFLTPGQQAVVSDNGNLGIRSGVDIEKVIAWKNGYFDFKNMNLAAIMRQAARWYDIQVNYNGETAGMVYTGKISRDVNLSELLNMLQYTGLKYKMDGKNITILP